MIKKQIVFLFFILNLLVVFDLKADIKFESKTSTINLKTDASTLTLKDQLRNFSGKLKIYNDSSLRIVSNTANDVIVFADGLIDSGTGDMSFTGTYVPGSSTNFTLSTGSTINLTGVSLSRGVSVGSGQSAVLSGSPRFTNPLTLGSSTSTLNLGLINKLDQNVILTGGTVKLDEDLRFKDGCGFSGSGTINVNQRTLVRSGGFAYNGVITYLNALDIQYTDNQTLNAGTELYSGSGLFSLVNGNGYTLTMTGTAKIQVDVNHKLYLTDMRIKGLGVSGVNGVFDIDVTSTIVLSNVTLDLGANYTHNKGTILVQGDNCKIIHHDKTFTVNSGQTRLAVDGVALLYEPLTGLTDTPFVFADLTQHLVTSNGGVIRTAMGGGGGGEAALTITATSYSLTQNQRLTSTSGISITNATPGTPKAVAVDGAGYYLQFPNASGSFLSLADNVQLTLTNIVLKDFNPTAISYGGSAATITFGDGVRIELAKDLNIQSGDKAWVFSLSGTGAVIDGKGKTLTSEYTNKITTTGSGTLSFENMVLKTLMSGAISCLTYNSKIRLDNTAFLFNQNGFAFSLGSISCQGPCSLTGTNTSSAGGTSTFTFSSTGTLTVESQSSLEVAQDTTLLYQPNPGPGNENLATSKRHFVLTDPSSSLILNSCTLQTTNTGMALNYGKLIVRNLATLLISTSTLANFELGSAVDLQIMGGGILSVDGPLSYVPTSYP